MHTLEQHYLIECKPEIKKDAGVITYRNAGSFPKFYRE